MNIRKKNYDKRDHFQNKFLFRGRSVNLHFEQLGETQEDIYQCEKENYFAITLYIVSSYNDARGSWF